MNFNTLKQELFKKISKMSEDDFINFLIILINMYNKHHNNKFEYGRINWIKRILTKEESEE